MLPSARCALHSLQELKDSGFTQRQLDASRAATQRQLDSLRATAESGLKERES